MGNIENFFKSNIKKFSPLALDKIKIENHKEFSLEYNKKKAKNLYEQSLSEKDESKKLKLLEQSLNYNNVNEKVIIDYLKVLKKIDKNKFKKEKLIYAPAISKKNFDSLFKSEASDGEREELQKINPLEKIKKMMELIMNFDRRNIDSKHTIFEYFYLLYSESEFIPNVDFSFEDNEELYTLFLYDWIYSKIHMIISETYKEIKTSNKEFQQKLLEFCSFTDDKNEIQKSKTEDNEYNNKLIFLYSNFFRYFNIARNYINFLSKLINQCLGNWNKETLYIFRYIIYEMIDYIIGNKKLNGIQSKEFTELENYYNSKQEKINLQDIDNKEFNEMNIKIEGNNLILNIEGKVVTLEDYNHYNLIDLLYYLYTIDDYHESSFNLYKYKFINIKYFNENNIIRACDKFISKFLEYIGKSETIVSLLNTVFPGYSINENTKFESWLPSYLLNFYKKINFYQQDLMTVVLTQNSNMEINYLFFVYDNESMRSEVNTFSSVVANLGFFIYCFYHESLGKLLLRFLNILTKMNYEIPKNDNDENESENFIESLLFHKMKDEYNIYELLYIIDIDNYKVNFKTFRKKFECVNMGYQPSQNFINMFKDIGLETEINLRNIKSRKNIMQYSFGSKINGTSDIKKYGPINLNGCVIRKEELDKSVNEFHRNTTSKYGSVDNLFKKIFSLLNKENE